MQTIEAAVLVPLGLGLLTVLLMLTFYLHDQTVLAADYGAMILEWQQSPKDSGEMEEEAEVQLQKGVLITDISLTEVSFGKQICRLKAEENWRVFQQGLNLLSLGNVEAVKSRSFTVIKIDACWLKRIWRASGLG